MCGDKIFRNGRSEPKVDMEKFHNTELGAKSNERIFRKFCSLKAWDYVGAILRLKPAEQALGFQCTASRCNFGTHVF
jgi:hypothetical protein